MKQEAGGKVSTLGDGDSLVVESGASIVVEAGGSLVENGDSLTVVDPDDVTLEESGGVMQVKDEGIGMDKLDSEVTAMLEEVLLSLDIADASAEATYYLVAPFAGVISKIYTVIDGVVSTADITVTAKIGATAITNGVVTIATAASAAGDVDVATPSALNAVNAGDAINFVVTGGGAGGSPRIHLVAVLTRS